jgi:hypothetical protein
MNCCAIAPTTNIARSWAIDVASSFDFLVKKLCE